MGYTEKMDADEQITMEEEIASAIFETLDESDEDECAHLGREILLMVLMKFRPDLAEGVEEEDDPDE
jgi:hypothetical protein